MINYVQYMQDALPLFLTAWKAGSCCDLHLSQVQEMGLLEISARRDQQREPGAAFVS